MSGEKMSTKSKALIAGGVLVTGGAIYFLWDKFFKNKDTKENEEEAVKVSSVPKVSTSSAKIRNDSFPLKRGSLGSRVRTLQQAVQKIVGKTAYPDSEIDGDYGPKTESALISAGLPTIIDETTYNRIAGQNASLPALTSSFNAMALCNELISYVTKANLSGVLSVLKQFRSVSDYIEVNKYFIASQLLSVSRSIVTYLLDITFSNNESAKKEIRKEFLRIGLKSSASDPINQTGTWSLSGIGNEIITITDTYVLDKNNNKIAVKARTILGEQLQIRNGLTYFMGLDGQTYSVPTIRVKNA